MLGNVLVVELSYVHVGAEKNVKVHCALNCSLKFNEVMQAHGMLLLHTFRLVCR